MRRKCTARLLSFGAVLLCLGGTGCQTGTSDAPTVVYSADAPMWDLSSTGFIEEMVFPQATERTPHFNDYTKGSYQVHKGDLIDAVGVFRAEKGIPVLAVMALGPMGKLKQYHVVTVVADTTRPGWVRVNEIVFPQKRISSKFTALRKRKDMDALLDALTASPLLRTGYPPRHQLYPEHSDLSVYFAVADWRNPEPVVRHGEPVTLKSDAPEVEAFWRTFEGFADSMSLTYSTYLPRAYLYPEGTGEK